MSANNHEEDNTRTHVVLTKGTMVSHYRIVDKIGAGGMGEVYLAHDTELDRKVALKFLPPHMCRDEDCRARFKREAQAAAKLDHPNIAGIYEVGDYQGRPYYAMQLIEGQSLGEVIAGNDLPIERILEFAIQICEGLQAAHDKGIIHRDIKPSNVLIDGHGRVRVVDFGLAAVAGTDQLTKTGSTLGTVGYMSPEQVKGEKVDHRSDLFSVGVVLYEMITGRTPFGAEYEAAIHYNIINEAPEPMSRYKSGVSNELQQIVDKALGKNPLLRYQHADDLAADLKRVLLLAPPPKKRLITLWVSVAVVIVIGSYFGQWMFSSKKPAAEQPEKIMLAVLPFENLGDPEDGYFADGMTDEIISRLAALHGLGVISRTSSLQYKGTTKNLRQIGAELGVDVILEGTIRWDKSGEADRVRINPQLIRVDDDVHLWADRYEAVIDNIFALQSDIAEKVVEELDLTLLESERQALTEPPTDNVVAYDYYLRAIDYLYLPPRKDHINNAIAMFHEAIEMEPDFAAAHLWLSFAHGQMYLFGFDHTDERLNLSKASIDRALEISPDNPEVHLALGWYYYQCIRDFDRAFDEFTIVREKFPSDATAYMGIAVIKRVKGDWEASAQNWKQAVEFDPLAARVCFEYGYTLAGLRRYEEAMTLYDRALRLSQDWRTLYTDKAWLYIDWKGDTKAARQVIQEALQANERWPDLTMTEIEMDILDRDYNQALYRLSEPGKIIELFGDSVPYYGLKGNVYRHLQRTDDMIACYDSSRIILEERIKAEPEDPRYRAQLGYVYAGLGRNEDAIRESELAVEIMPVSKNAIQGVNYLQNLTFVYILVGEYDSAIDQLDLLLSIPSEVSVPYLEISPDYDPLRDLPRFRALIKKYKAEHAT